MSDAYDLDPDFERAVAILCCTRPKFFGAVGRAINIDSLSIAECKLVIKAAYAIAKDVGHGPTNQMMVMQRLHRWKGEGSVSQKQINNVVDMFLDAPSLPPEKDVIAELAPILKRRVHQDVVRDSIEEFQRRGDFQLLVKKINEAARIGSHDVSLGTRLGPNSFDEIHRVRFLDKLPLGITELDMGLNNGLPRGCICVYVGGTGGGKSMFLSHTASHALANGLFVVYATLELSQAVILARVKACLTGEAIDSIMDGQDAKARKMIDEMYPLLGTMIVKDFPAKATTMLDIREWVKECEDDEGHEVDVVVIDYGDKMKSHNTNDKNEYAGQGTVFEDFRLFMVETGKWGLTASQAKNKAAREKRRKIEADDLADSSNKARVADLVVSINPTPEGDELEFFVPKNRNGRSQFSVGPLPHDWACGRMASGEEPRI